ncbi:MAG: c-type cytochrome [Egibacteraceae bacterium]
MVLIAASVAVVVARAPDTAAAQQLEPQERARAQQLYASQCASCHGASGQGGIIPGTDDPVPALQGNPEVTVSYLDLVMRVGRMPPPENAPFDNRARTVTLDDTPRQIVVDYLAEEFDIPGEVPEVGEGDAGNGRDVFAANCAQCHGSTGAGGVAGAGAWTPPVSGKGAVTIAEAIRVGPFAMPQFTAEQISDSEIADIAAFMAEVGAEQGTPIIGLTELNPVYASGFAALFVFVVIIAVLIIAGRPTWFPDPAGQHEPRQDEAAEHHQDPQP